MSNPRPTYDPTTERALGLFASLMTTSHDWVNLAMACIDQAGYSIPAQLKIARVILREQPENE